MSKGTENNRNLSKLVAIQDQTYTVLTFQTMKWEERGISGVSQHSPAPTPSRAVYGFVLHLLSLALLLLYLCWALLPPSILASVGLHFLPQQYWAVAIPTYLSVLFFTFVLVVYPALGQLATPGSGDIRHVSDSKTFYSEGPALEGAVPPLYDERPEDVLAHIRLKSK